MNRQRRRACDFTTLLKSFQSTVTQETDFDDNAATSFSQDSLDEIKSNDTSLLDNAGCNERHSIILAGSSIKVSHIEKLSFSMGVSKDELPPDLNKCINLFQSEKMLMGNKENNDPQYPTESMSVNKHNPLLVLAQKEAPPVVIRKINFNETSKRDSNYNIQVAASNSICTPKQSLPYQQSNSGKRETKNDQKTFETLLCYLQNEFNEMQEVSEICPQAMPQKILKRLSNVYQNSPRNFTEKLLTVIEDSVVREDDLHTSAINLSRLTGEFRKMCKFIEDETVPQWPSSPLSYTAIIDKIDDINGIHSKIKKKNLFKSAECLTAWPCKDDTVTFEKLEVHCCPNEVERTPHRHRSLSLSSLMEQKNMYRKYAEQIALLNSESLSAQSPDIPKSVEISRAKTNKVNSNYKKIDPDELERTLIQSIAEKRKRCLDTAKLITQINADPKLMEAQKSLKSSPMFVNSEESNSVTNNETEFLNTLMSCKNYHTYLKKQKPVLKLLKNSDTSLTVSSSEENQLKPAPQYLEKKKIAKKPKYFVTPEKNSVTSCRRAPKKPLFNLTPKTPANENGKKKQVNSNTNNSCGRRKEDYLLKSPHADGLYRLNYNTVVSPVSMYINGTDMRLLTNVNVKTDPSLLTPVRKKAEALLAGNLGRATSSKSITRSQEKLSLKVKFTPKLNRNLNFGPKEVNTDIKLPKVSYKLPSQVQTTAGKSHSRTPKIGNRVKALLHDTESKVVIRHEGRINSVLKGRTTGATENDEVPEIIYKSDDESFHIEQPARKTNFIRGRNKI